MAQIESAQHDLSDLLEKISDSESSSTAVKKSSAGVNSRRPGTTRVDPSTGFATSAHLQVRTGSAVVEKRKLRVEIQIKTGHVAVQEP